MWVTAVSDPAGRWPWLAGMLVATRLVYPPGPNADLRPTMIRAANKCKPASYWARVLFPYKDDVLFYLTSAGNSHVKGKTAVRTSFL